MSPGDGDRAEEQQGDAGGTGQHEGVAGPRRVGQAEALDAPREESLAESTVVSSGKRVRVQNGTLMVPGARPRTGPFSVRADDDDEPPPAPESGRWRSRLPTVERE